MINKNIKKTISKIKNKNTPNGVRVDTRTQTQVTFTDVINEVEKLGEKRSWIMKTILAVYVSTFTKPETDPLWLMIVGNPSSNKTTLVNLIKKASDTIAVDSLTANPFSSGQKETKNDKAKDLLPYLNGKCFIIKEYGTLFSKSDELVKSLIGDLTAIYDGVFTRHSPTRGTVTHETYFSHMGCVTPMALNKRHKYMSSVGARFLFLKIPRLDDLERENCLKAVWRNNKQDKKYIESIVVNFCKTLKKRANDKIFFSTEAQIRLNQFSNFIARTRGIVINASSSSTSDNGLQKNYSEIVDRQIEEPFRALKQIKKLARCLAIVGDKEAVGDEELEIVRKIILSSMPQRRANVLEVFKFGKIFTAQSAAEFLQKNDRTVKRNFDDLVALQVLEKNLEENQRAYEYKLKSEFESIFPTKEDL